MHRKHNARNTKTKLTGIIDFPWIMQLLTALQYSRSRMRSESCPVRSDSGGCTRPRTRDGGRSRQVHDAPFGFSSIRAHFTAANSVHDTYSTQNAALRRSHRVASIAAANLLIVDVHGAPAACLIRGNPFESHSDVHTKRETTS